MSTQSKVYSSGDDPKEAEFGMIMLHGRGSDINDMKSVIPPLHLKKVHLLMPEAPIEIMPGRYAWYQHFWNENLDENLSQLHESFEIIDKCVQQMQNGGIETEDIVMFGHSQGANLLLEYFAANPQNFKAVLLLRACFLGEFTIDRSFDKELPENTPVIIHAGRKDPYIPQKKVDQTVEQLDRMGANVTKRLYETGHGICRPELVDIKKMFRNKEFE